MPPSTRKVAAGMNDASSLARKGTAAAVTPGSANRPIRARTKPGAAPSSAFANSPLSIGVLTGPGHRALTRIPSLANCTASSRLMASTPPLLAVYEICEVAEPSTATNDAVLMIEPPPCTRICSMAYLLQRKTEVRLTSCTRRHASSPVVRMESSSGGEIPALLNATSRPPKVSTARSKSLRTSPSAVTSVATNSPPTSSAAALPLASSTSAHTIWAPSAPNRRTVASPMPLPAPVTTATLPASRPAGSAMSSPRTMSAGRDEHVLGLGERQRRVRSELTAEAGGLEPAERRPVAHRRVGVDGKVSCLDASADADGAADIPRPDRAGQPELGVVRDADGVFLVVERHHRDHGAEDLLVQDRVRRIARCQDRGGEPVAGPAGGTAAEGHLTVVAHVRRDPVAMSGTDQGTHLGLVVGRVGDDDSLHCLLELRHEVVVRRSLHEDARARAAVLTGVVEDGVRRRRGSLLHVGVGAHHVRALAAQLQRHGLYPRGAPGHDLPAHLGRAGEDDLRDVRRVDEPLPDDAALARQHLEHVRWQPRVERELREPERRHRGQLGGLEDDGVPRRQRGRQAPTGDGHRKVPRHDHADDAEWLGGGGGQAAGDRNLPSAQPLRRTGVVVEDVTDVARLPARVADGVAGVGDLELRELLAGAVDRGRETPQQPRPVARGDVAPALESQARSADRGVGGGRIELRHSRHRLFGCGVDDVVGRSHRGSSYMRSNERMRSQSVTDPSKAAISTRAALV